MPASAAQAVALCGNLNFMETHGIHPEAGRKEISCSDCGHVYLIAQGQRSGTCRNCGNVEFFSEAGPASRELTALSEEIAARRVLPRLEERVAVDPLAAFRI